MGETGDGSSLGSGAGRSSSWTDVVVKHVVIPAHSGESAGITMTPAHIFDKVLVAPISESGEKQNKKTILSL